MFTTSSRSGTHGRQKCHLQHRHSLTQETGRACYCKRSSSLLLDANQSTRATSLVSGRVEISREEKAKGYKRLVPDHRAGLSKPPNEIAIFVSRRGSSKALSYPSYLADASLAGSDSTVYFFVDFTRARKLTPRSVDVHIQYLVWLPATSVVQNRWRDRVLC